MSDREEVIRERLEGIAEDLRELEYESLARRAADPEGDDAAEAREAERRAAKARRAVVRAIGALGGAEEGSW